MQKYIHFKAVSARALALLVMTLLCSALALAQHDDHGDHAGHGDHGGHDDHHEQRGPHRGRLLEQGDVTVELAIFEQGVPPEFRAWVSQDGQPVEQAQLQVQLTRLGGQVDTFNFTKQGDYWLGDGVVEEPHSFDVEAMLKLDGKQLHWEWESHEGRTHIDPDMAAKIGITTATAGPGTIAQTLTTYGKTAVPAGQTAHVRARFAGVITEVKANVGDAVNAGDVLAQVEANESLKKYPLHAPIAGVITERHATVGESATDQALFTIANLDPLWAELKVFPAQRSKVAPGQPVAVLSDDLRQQTTLRHLLPSSEGSPFVVARADVANENGQWVPGLLVTGEVVVDTATVPLVVDNRALQPFNDWTVVFIQVGDTYEIRPLNLGRSDGQFTEVLEGLKPGDRYVVENSYLIKADIEKSGAAHHH